MKPAPYCLPIITGNSSEVLDVIHVNLASYQYFEVWLDYVEELDDSFIQQLVNLLGNRLILLFRRQNLRTVQMTTEKLHHILNMLSNVPVLVDLDITTQQSELDYIRDNKLSIDIIASHHDYKQTPDLYRLKSIIKRMDAYNPAIYKISTYCNEPADALRLLGVLLDLQAKAKPAIILGMGEHGQITRIFGSLWGNHLAFAPLTTTAQSAPGQLTYHQLETIYNELRLDNATEHAS